MLLGPRRGRFDDEGNPQVLAPSSLPIVTLGTFILWFGWFGFNAGSTLQLSGNFHIMAGRCVVNTTLSAAAGGLTAMGIVKAVKHKYSDGAFCNGILGGLVGITAGCNAVDTWAAVLIGVLSGIQNCT